jgi:hypothetical protein
MIQDLEIFTFLSLVLFIIFAGVLLYIFTKLINKLVDYFTSGKVNRKYINRGVIYFEIFVWFAYIIWSVDLLVTSQMLNNLVVLSLAGILVLLLMWFIGKDSVIGLIFRLENTIETGDKIMSSEGNGVIKKMGVRVLTIESDSGHLFYLPYSKLSSEKITVIDDDLKYQPFEFKLSIGNKENPQQLKKKIFEAIIFSPYSSSVTPPVVAFKGESGGKYQFDIVLSALNSDFFNRIVSDLNSRLID